MNAGRKWRFYFPLRGVTFGAAYLFRCIVIKIFRFSETWAEYLGLSSAICMRHLCFCPRISLSQLPIWWLPSISKGKFFSISLQSRKFFFPRCSLFRYSLSSALLISVSGNLCCIMAKARQWCWLGTHTLVFWSQHCLGSVCCPLPFMGTGLYPDRIQTGLWAFKPYLF